MGESIHDKLDGERLMRASLNELFRCGVWSSLLSLGPVASLWGDCSSSGDLLVSSALKLKRLPTEEERLPRGLPSERMLLVMLLFSAACLFSYKYTYLYNVLFKLYICICIYVRGLLRGHLARFLELVAL